MRELLEKSNLTPKDYLACARILKTSLEPDALLKLFDHLQTKKHEASFAYLYVLFELRLIDKARDFLDDNTLDNDFEKFRILLYLRDQGKVVDTDLIIC
jgi:hypothetical protein